MNTIYDNAARLSEPTADLTQSMFETIGRWHRQLGRIHLAMSHLEDASYPAAQEWFAEDVEFELERVAEDAIISLRTLGVEDPASALGAEYERAAAKHPGMTLDADGHTDETRFYALAEEVGEVAASLTYDNTEDTGHNANTIAEVTQVGALALAWLTRYQEGGER